MTELTTSQIVASLKREDLPAAHYHELMRVITARRAHLKARLESIESRNGAGLRAAIASGEAEQLAALNREAETIDDELGLLSHAESRASQLGMRAAERETLETGARAHRRLLSLIGTAESAVATYLDARQQLQDATGAIGGANQLKPDARQFVVDDTVVERIMGALWPSPLVREEQQRGARSGLRRQVCAPDPPNYGEPAPDLAEQRHRNIFQRRDS